MMPSVSVLLRCSETPAGAPAPVRSRSNFGLFFWTWLVFLALLFLLKKFAWPAILGRRWRRGRSGWPSRSPRPRACRTRRSGCVEQSQKALADGRGQAQTLLAEAKTQSERERTAAVERTKAEQDDLLARARREISAERDRAIGELRREAVDLSLAAASKLVGERLDSEADRKLVTGYLATLGEKH